MPSRARRAWDDRLQARAARRRANDQALSAGAAASGAGQTGAERPLPFLCECADTGCDAVVWLTASEYGRIRDERGRFVVDPAHAHDDVDILVLANELYAVVRRTPSEVFLG